MRILYVVHQFLPRHIAGTEIYTNNLARGIQGRGHDVAVFTTEAYHGESQATLREKDLDGLRVFEAVHNNVFPSFEGSYLDAEKESQFQQVLDEFAPDVVHFQHLHQHSIRNIRIAKDRGLRVAYTLHEFSLLCVHHGWLTKPGYELCAGPKAIECAACAKTCMPTPSAGDSDENWIEAWRAREAAVREALDLVDIFVSPSRFLRQRFIDAGWIDESRIVFSDNGMPAHTTQPHTRSRADRLRIGFLGTIAEWKGVHVLVDAMNRLADDEASLDVFGVLEYFPAYVEALRALATHPAIAFHGRYDNGSVSEILASIDVLVVPSLWYENSPITIHEAFMAGVPVVASNAGGMAEFVDHEMNGLHFAIGNADSLRAALRRLIDEPELLPRLREGMPKFKTIEEDCETWDRRYHELIG